jgi:hypothetical protein
MNTYKITNITNQLNKRDRKYKSGVEIVYVDKRIKKTIKIADGQTIYLAVVTLPLIVNRLRIKNLITVSEVSALELAKSKKPVKPKAVKKPVEKKVIAKTNTPKIETKSTTSSKKKTTKPVDIEEGE